MNISEVCWCGNPFACSITPLSTAQEEGDSLIWKKSRDRPKRENPCRSPVSIRCLREPDSGPNHDQSTVSRWFPAFTTTSFSPQLRASVRGVQGNEVATNRTQAPPLSWQCLPGFLWDRLFNTSSSESTVVAKRGLRPFAFGGAITTSPATRAIPLRQRHLNVNTRYPNSSEPPLRPVNDTLGYQLEASMEDSDAPDDYISLTVSSTASEVATTFPETGLDADDAFTAEVDVSTVNG